MKRELPNNAIDKVKKCADRLEPERMHVVPEDDMPERPEPERDIRTFEGFADGGATPRT